MIFNRDCIHLFETYDIKLSDSVLIKLEDSLINNKELLITIDASHYGFRNGNWVVYRHDTVRDDISSFVMPPRPIIEKHNLKESKKFGSIIAADYKETAYYSKLKDDGLEIDNLTTEQYIEMIRDNILPIQFKDRNFNGLGFVQVVGRIRDKQGVKKILNKEFLSVSIGAIPRKLICSECLRDQTDGLCEHYGSKSNKIFMLAESLEYEELSFVNKPADPFGKIVRIHDGLLNETKIERNTEALEASVDAIVMKDFFNSTRNTIVCVDNICTIINQEDGEMGKAEGETRFTLSLSDEFGEDKICTLCSKFDGVNGEVKLSDELTDKHFAIVQKTTDGLLRRFPIQDELNVRIGLTMLDSASDLTSAEKDKVRSNLEKAAKKLGISSDLIEQDKLLKDEIVNDLNNQSDPEKLLNNTIESLNSLLRDRESIEKKLEDNNGILKDEIIDPVSRIFEILKSLAFDFKYAGLSLEGSISSYLEEKGKELIAKQHKDELEEENSTLKDHIVELESDIALLDEQNRDLNYQLRVTLVDEIISSRDILGLLEDTKDAEKNKYSKLNYDALVTQVNDYRHMKVKLKDNIVNNKLDIKKIADPTLTDSSDSSSVSNLQDGQLEDGSKKGLSFKEQVALVKACFRR